MIHDTIGKPDFFDAFFFFCSFRLSSTQGEEGGTHAFTMITYCTGEVQTTLNCDIREARARAKGHGWTGTKTALGHMTHTQLPCRFFFSFVQPRTDNQTTSSTKEERKRVLSRTDCTLHWQHTKKRKKKGVTPPNHFDHSHPRVGYINTYTYPYTFVLNINHPSHRAILCCTLKPCVWFPSLLHYSLTSLYLSSLGYRPPLVLHCRHSSMQTCNILVCPVPC